MPKDFTGVYDVLDAIKDAIQSADPAKREALAQTLEAYHHDFPEEFHWALGVEAPMLLYHLLMTVTRKINRNRARLSGSSASRKKGTNNADRTPATRTHNRRVVADNRTAVHRHADHTHCNRAAVSAPAVRGRGSAGGSSGR
jgi:hypothetical protein